MTWHWPLCARRLHQKTLSCFAVLLWFLWLTLSCKGSYMLVYWKGWQRSWEFLLPHIIARLVRSGRQVPLFQPLSSFPLISLSTPLLTLIVWWPLTSWQCFACDSHLSHLSRNEAVPGAVERTDSPGRMSKPPLLNFLPCDWCGVYLRAGFMEATGVTENQKNPPQKVSWKCLWIKVAEVWAALVTLSLSLQTEVCQFNLRGIAVLLHVLLMALRPDCSDGHVAERHMLSWLLGKFLRSLMHRHRLGKRSVKPRSSRRALRDVSWKRLEEFCHLRAARSGHLSWK